MDIAPFWPCLIQRVEARSLIVHIRIVSCKIRAVTDARYQLFLLPLVATPGAAEPGWPCPKSPDTPSTDDGPPRICSGPVPNHPEFSFEHCPSPRNLAPGLDGNSFRRVHAPPRRSRR